MRGMERLYVECTSRWVVYERCSTRRNRIHWRRGQGIGRAARTHNDSENNEWRTNTHRTRNRCNYPFWWHLQEHRAAFLRKKYHDDAAEIILDQDEIRKVKRILEDQEFWYDLTPKQQKEHRPSTYNAMLHNRCGWSTASNAIIQYKLPRLPYLPADDDIRQHLQRVDQFCSDLLTWLKRFAEAVLEKKQEEEKNKRKKKKRRNPIKRVLVPSNNLCQCYGHWWHALNTDALWLVVDFSPCIEHVVWRTHSCWC